MKTTAKVLAGLLLGGILAVAVPLALAQVPLIVNASGGGSVNGTAIAPLSVTTTGANGEAHGCAWHSTTLTFAANPGDASKTASGLIAAGSTLQAVATRVIVAGTNCTSFTVGDGVTAALWGTGVSPALNTTTNNASATAGWLNPMLTAGDVVLTAAGGNCFGLSARVSVFYCTTTAPTN